MSDNNFRKGPHASKNRPADSDIEVVADGAVSSSDERKTVILDEDLEGVEFEDKVWLYWKRNKNFLVFSIAAAFAIVIGVQGFKIWKSTSANAVAAGYAAASTPEQLAKFASEYAGKPAAGVALLQNADTLFTQSKFAEAEKIYNDSLSSLRGTVLEGRAMIGAAACAANLDAVKGAEAFKKVSENQSVDPAYRAQASYQLGLLCVKAGKTGDAKAAFKAAVSNPAGGYFARLAEVSLEKLD